MSRSLNRVQLLGHLGQDAEVKYTPNGIQVARLSIATTRRWKDKQTNDWKDATEWHRCILWRCENVANFLTKGKQVYIDGRLQTRSWDKDGQKHYATEIICEELILLGGGQQQQQPNAPRSQSPAPSANGPDSIPPDQGVTDDDVPF